MIETGEEGNKGIRKRRVKKKGGRQKCILEKKEGDHRGGSSTLERGDKEKKRLHRPQKKEKKGQNSKGRKKNK